MITGFLSLLPKLYYMGKIFPIYLKMLIFHIIWINELQPERAVWLFLS